MRRLVSVGPALLVDRLRPPVTGLRSRLLWRAKAWSALRVARRPGWSRLAALSEFGRLPMSMAAPQTRRLLGGFAEVTVRAVSCEMTVVASGAPKLILHPRSAVVSGRRANAGVDAGSEVLFVLVDPSPFERDVSASVANDLQLWLADNESVSAEWRIDLLRGRLSLSSLTGSSTLAFFEACDPR